MGSKRSLFVTAFLRLVPLEVFNREQLLSVWGFFALWLDDFVRFSCKEQSLVDDFLLVLPCFLCLRDALVLPRVGNASLPNK